MESLTQITKSAANNVFIETSKRNFLHRILLNGMQNQFAAHSSTVYSFIQAYYYSIWISYIKVNAIRIYIWLTSSPQYNK